jgi:KDO2-lipid IV(A) lauroyltransferase
MATASTERPPLSPSYWLSWMLVAFLWLLGKTPQRLGLAITIPLGTLLFHLMLRRRRIAERNIERCFPELTGEERRRLLKAHFRSLARMVFETAWSWSGSPRRLVRMGQYEGLEHIDEAKKKGGGILVITAHVTCLEIGGRLAAIHLPEARGVYRPLNNPVVEWYQNRSRAKYTQGSISKRDMRSVVRFLRGGGVIWYAPDQDFGAKRSVFVPFFGIQTATLEATGRLVEMSGCTLIPMFPVYDPSSRKYVVRFYPAIENFPSGDLHEDLARLNKFTETLIRQAPEQYWWIHRRFKTRPEGEPPFYD